VPLLFAPVGDMLSTRRRKEETYTFPCHFFLGIILFRCFRAVSATFTIIAAESKSFSPCIGFCVLSSAAFLHSRFAPDWPVRELARSPSLTRGRYGPTILSGGDFEVLRFCTLAHCPLFFGYPSLSPSPTIQSPLSPQTRPPTKGPCCLPLFLSLFNANLNKFSTEAASPVFFFRSAVIIDGCLSTPPDNDEPYFFTRLIKEL